jgi:hypothetical protein
MSAVTLAAAVVVLEARELAVAPLEQVPAVDYSAPLPAAPEPFESRTLTEPVPLETALLAQAPAPAPD